MGRPHPGAPARRASSPVNPALRRTTRGYPRVGEVVGTGVGEPVGIPVRVGTGVGAAVLIAAAVGDG